MGGGRGCCPKYASQLLASIELTDVTFCSIGAILHTFPALFSGPVPLGHRMPHHLLSLAVTGCHRQVLKTLISSIYSVWRFLTPPVLTNICRFCFLLSGLNRRLHRIVENNHFLKRARTAPESVPFSLKQEHCVILHRVLCSSFSALVNFAREHSTKLRENLFLDLFRSAYCVVSGQKLTEQRKSRNAFSRCLRDAEAAKLKAINLQPDKLTNYLEQ